MTLYLNHRIALDGELTDGLEIIVRIPDTPGFEFRLKNVEEDLLFQGLEVEALLLDRQVVDAQTVVALAAELLIGGAGSEIILSLRDRLIGLGDLEQAAAVEQIYAARIRRNCAGAIQRNRMLAPMQAAKPAEAAGGFAVIDLLALDDAGRTALQRMGCIPEFLEMTWLGYTIYILQT